MFYLISLIFFIFHILIWDLFRFIYSLLFTLQFDMPMTWQSTILSYSSLILYLLLYSANIRLFLWCRCITFHLLFAIESHNFIFPHLDKNILQYHSHGCVSFNFFTLIILCQHPLISQDIRGIIFYFKCLLLHSYFKTQHITMHRTYFPLFLFTTQYLSSSNDKYNKVSCHID